MGSMTGPEPEGTNQHHHVVRGLPGRRKQREHAGISGGVRGVYVGSKVCRQLDG